MTYDEIQAANRLIFDRLALLLNTSPDFVTADMVKQLADDFGLTVSDAYSLLLCAALGFDTEQDFDRRLWQGYAPHMLHHLDQTLFTENPFYKAVKTDSRRVGEWELRTDRIAPFTAFVCDDPLTLPDGRVIPQIGFFDSEFEFLSVLQNGREWMTMMPNEIVTQRLPIQRAHGRVATYGLGLGYFAYMCALKDSVESVTVIERDESAVKLFNELILPCFTHPEKLHVVVADAFDYAEKIAPTENFDYIFADIWHDPSDGVEAYKRFKTLEPLCPCTEFDYWIEKTLKLYM